MSPPSSKGDFPLRTPPRKVHRIFICLALQTALVWTSMQDATSSAIDCPILRSCQPLETETFRDRDHFLSTFLSNFVADDDADVQTASRSTHFSMAFASAGQRHLCCHGIMLETDIHAKQSSPVNPALSTFVVMTFPAFRSPSKSLTVRRAHRFEVVQG